MKYSCLITLLVAVVITACGVRKNTKIETASADSTRVVSSATEEHFSHFRVDTTVNTDYEFIVTKTTYFDPVVLQDGTIVANCIKSVEQIEDRKKRTATGSTQATTVDSIATATDSTTVTASSTATETIYTDTKRAGKISVMLAIVVIAALIFACVYLITRKNAD